MSMLSAALEKLAKEQVRGPGRGRGRQGKGKGSQGLSGCAGRQGEGEGQPGVEWVCRPARGRGRAARG